MKRFFTVLAFSTLLSSGKAQDMNALKSHYLKVYNQGLVYNDVSVAINGLQGYLAIDSNVLYRDTLSMLYFSTKNYMSSLILAEEVFTAVPANVMAKARAAECYDELGDPKTATTLFEQVVPQTRNPYHIYKLAVCQYQLKRMGESEASARAALADTNSKRIGVNFMSVDGSQQAVPVNAAAANLLGVIKMDAKNFAGAKADFQQALTLFPKFEGAKQNLDACDRSLKGPKPPAKPKN